MNEIVFLGAYFLVYAFIGWCLESVYKSVLQKKIINSGFLHGPICPIYGYGALMLIIFFNKYQKHNFKLFIYSAVVFSAFEYFVSYILDAMFAMHWWDYTNEFFNLNGRISIFYSFAWGIIAILFINHVYPFFKKHVNIILSKIPYILQIILVYSFSVILVVDTIASCVRYLN